MAVNVAVSLTMTQQAVFSHGRVVFQKKKNFYSGKTKILSASMPNPRLKSTVLDQAFK
jgi:hypothetical protein